jgi:hypothetical protein
MKNYFLVVVSFLAVVSVAIFEVESEDILEVVSVDILEVESAAALSEPALLQAAKAPIANTNKNFFICDCFLN